MKSSAVPLLTGTDSLVFLHHSLEMTEDVWDDAFTSEIATLESAGLATPQQVSEMGVAYQATITKALDELEALVLRRVPADSLDEDDHQ
jgi:hypothetical protein